MAHVVCGSGEALCHSSRMKTHTMKKNTEQRREN